MTTLRPRENTFKVDLSVFPKRPSFEEIHSFVHDTMGLRIVTDQCTEQTPKDRQPEMMFKVPALPLPTNDVQCGISETDESSSDGSGFQGWTAVSRGQQTTSLFQHRSPDEPDVSGILTAAPTQDSHNGDRDRTP
ncbi:hypothetical protein quinque_005757 [Culex quinquefasciatus]